MRTVKQRGVAGLLPLLLAISMVSACDGGTVELIDLGVPSQQMPPDASEQQNALELRWGSVEGAGVYHVQISDDGQFDDVGLDAKSVDSNLMPINELAVGSTYFWRVRAKGDGEPGEWSPIWSFTVTSPAPLPGFVELEWPPDGSGDINRDLILLWKPAHLATKYHVQVSQEPVFLRRDADLWHVLGEAQEINNLDSTYVYFWRVRSGNLAGYGDWSPTWSFVVEKAEGWVPGT